MSIPNMSIAIVYPVHTHLYTIFVVFVQWPFQVPKLEVPTIRPI